MSNAAYDFQIVCPTLQGLVPGQDIHVTYWKGSEAVSQLYQFEIKFAVRQANLALEKLLNEPATFIAHKPDGSVLRWHGIVTGGSQQGRDETYDYYQVILEPRLAKLRTQFWSDIYLDKQLDDIIGQLLQSIGLDEPYSGPDAPYDYHIAAGKMANTKRPFVCQFEETCLAFLMRKLEFYGVYFWFEQGKDHESVVFANSVDQQPSDPDSAVYYPRGVIDPDAQEVVITQLNRSVSMRPGSVTLHDSTTWQNTLMSLDSSATAPGPIPAFGEEHRYRNHYETVSDSNAHGDPVVGGETLATWRSQEMACERERILGEAQTPGVRAGRMLEVSEYLRGTSPNQYYVIEVTHKGQQPLETAPDAEGSAYFSQFVALPRWLDANDGNPQPLQFRPVRATPVPVISQMVNGFVDIVDQKQPQRYAKMDAEGRYLVRLPFAKERYKGEQNSAWLRMATPYAAGASTPSMDLQPAGMHFPLRENTEVIIAFLNGDPDRPVIMAALPNVEAPSVVTSDNPSDHIVRTPSGNELALRDAPNEGDGKPTVLLSTPTQNTYLNLGTNRGKDEGFNLNTENSGYIKAQGSIDIEVPGHLRIRAGASGWPGLNSLQAPNLPSGMSINSSAGLAIQNYMGLKFETVEGVSLTNYIGGKVTLNESAEVLATTGAKMIVKFSAEQDINLRSKKHLSPEQKQTYGSFSSIVGRFTGTLIQKEETVMNYSITAVESYTVTSPTLCVISSTASAINVSPGTLNMSATNVALTGASSTLISGDAVNVAAASDLSMASAGEFNIAGVSLNLASEGIIQCEASAIKLGAGTVLIG